jgi:hypothetical protein
LDNTGWLTVQFPLYLSSWPDLRVRIR